MCKKISCVCLTFLPLVILILALSHPASPAVQNPLSESVLIDALDDCIQERFKDVDERFGFRRIIKPGDTPHRFKPENARELQAVGSLNQHGMSTALYLAGRSVLGKEPDAKEWETSQQGVGRGYPRRLIQGPVWITTRVQDNLPKPSQLWEKSREAMKAFSTKDSVEFAYGRWKFVARPVRASETSCLKCHTGDTTRILGMEDKSDKQLKIGDPLGVVLYAYQGDEKK